MRVYCQSREKLEQNFPWISLLLMITV